MFVGYSAYDLDIKRILLDSPEGCRKTFFAVGTNPTELTRHKLSKFGRVEEEDTASLSEKILFILKTYTPREHTAVSGQYVARVEAPAESSNPRDRDVLDLLLWGKMNRAFVWRAVTGSSTVPYVCDREAVSRCLQMLEDGERDIVVRSDLGNGKSVFLECLGVMAAQFGYAVLHLGNPGPDSVGEVEAAARCDEKTLLLVDSYISRRPEVEALAHHRSDQLRVVFAARTLRHDVSFAWLQDILGVDSIPEIDLDRLSKSDRQWFCDTLDTYGLWGERAEWSHHRKLTFLRDDCAGRVSSVLLAILSSPTIAERLTHAIKSISSTGRAYLEVAGIDELFSPGFVLHQPHLPDFLRGLEGARKMMSMGRDAAPDLQASIEDIIAEGDKVAVRWTFHGTRADTGEKFAVGVISFYRIADGKIAEDWGVGVYFQTGVSWE